MRISCIILLENGGHFKVHDIHRVFRAGAGAEAE